MPKSQKYQNAIERLKEYDEPAWRAVRGHLDQVNVGHWALLDYFDTDGCKAVYALTVQSMLTRETRTILMEQTGRSYSFSWSSGSTYS